MKSARAFIFGFVLLAAGCQLIAADLGNQAQATPVASQESVVLAAGTPTQTESEVDTTQPETGATQIAASEVTSDSVSSEPGEPEETPATDTSTDDSVADSPTDSVVDSAADDEGVELIAAVTPSYSSEQVAAGQVIYRQQYCGVCHTLDAIGTRGTFGPPHDQMGALAAQRVQDAAYSGEARDAAAYLYESLVQPERYIVPGYEATSHHMPPYIHLPEEDLQALVAFLLAQQ